MGLGKQTNRKTFSSLGPGPRRKCTADWLYSTELCKDVFASLQRLEGTVQDWRNGSGTLRRRGARKGYPQEAPAAIRCSRRVSGAEVKFSGRRLWGKVCYASNPGCRRQNRWLLNYAAF